MLEELRRVKSRVVCGSSVFNAINHDHVYDHLRKCVPMEYRGDLRKWDDDMEGSQYDRIMLVLKGIRLYRESHFNRFGFMPTE